MVLYCDLHPSSSSGFPHNTDQHRKRNAIVEGFHLNFTLHKYNKWYSARDDFVRGQDWDLNRVYRFKQSDIKVLMGHDLHRFYQLKREVKGP